MAEPPPSGPHSDISGVNRDYRAGIPNKDPKLGTAQSIDEADEDSPGRPDQDAVLGEGERLPNAQ